MYLLSMKSIFTIYITTKKVHLNFLLNQKNIYFFITNVINDKTTINSHC